MSINANAFNMNEKITAVLLTGAPGVGKTTLIRKICEQLQKSSGNIHCQGFYTEEVRHNGERIGFDVVTLEGQKGILARKQPSDVLSRPKIGQYAVYVNDFELIALPLLKSRNNSLLVIDEIGKMELKSKKFEDAIKMLTKEGNLLLATVPGQTKQPIAIVDNLKISPQSQVFEITKSNRNQIQQEVMKSIQSMISKE